jgi:hypothetical protein
MTECGESASQWLRVRLLLGNVVAIDNRAE